METSELEQLNPLAVPAYAVAALMVLIPVVDTVFALLPMHPGDVAWRFGAIGLGSQLMLSPLLGALVAFVTAALLGHRGGLRALQILCMVAAVLILAAVVLFVLDALQTRHQVQPKAKFAFDKATATALLKYFVGLAIWVAFVIAGQRLIGRRRAQDASEPDTPKLVSATGPVA